LQEIHNTCDHVLLANNRPWTQAIHEILTADWNQFYQRWRKWRIDSTVLLNLLWTLWRMS